MDLEDRVAELERRLAALEGADRGGGRAAHPEDSDFWALEGLKAKFAEGEVAHGGVLFTGAVRLPTGERYEWQQSLPTDALLGEDWSDVAESFAALGHSVRMRLLREILDGRRTVAELAALDGLGTTGQVYHHLRQLTSAGWLHVAGRGRYQVPPGRMVPLLVVLAASRP
ncbi:DNA-binding transcriptional ArsR family regulator [Streptosporangium album]|uniref:DNA-binding transcriptional ArsR family regulator n=1 Tax=Streptosporangium album TaxID=47479 RepID=A0A7W7S4S5_9ACTN|nr:winged helix-turn-helix domain-containing protein [Streptosporangium album]MBB4943893.1 DNA-binding transcriptional ArsR family regulator [Streptosporangium album]